MHCVVSGDSKCGHCGASRRPSLRYKVDHGVPNAVHGAAVAQGVVALGEKAMRRLYAPKSGMKECGWSQGRYGERGA